jgi:hypothetical protein
VQTLADLGADASLNAARECWTGHGWQSDRAEAGAATTLALRGREPFDEALDEDVRTAAQQRFVATTLAIFAALAGDAPVPAELMR